MFGKFQFMETYLSNRREAIFFSYDLILYAKDLIDKKMREGFICQIDASINHSTCANGVLDLSAKAFLLFICMYYEWFGAFDQSCLSYHIIASE